MKKDKPNEKNQSNSFPGYPHYPAGEDITRQGHHPNPIDEDEKTPEPEGDGIEPDIVMGTTADVTDEERRLLEAADQFMPGSEDEHILTTALSDVDDDGEPLNEQGFDEDAGGEDLDVPGTEADDAMEDIGEEDEENNYYSLGRYSQDEPDEIRE